jgi:uridine phosphorylase
VKPITFKTASGKAYHLEVDKLNPNILTAGSPGRVRKIAKHLKKAKIEEGDRGFTVVHGEYQGLPVSAFPTGMGPASTAVVIPEALEVTKGPITLLRLGTAGALQPFVGIGDLVISSAAIRDEGTTRAAVGPEYPALADPELVPVMAAASERHGYELWKNLWVGVGHVKDDLYFVETPQFSPATEFMMPKLESYKRMGALASSMEFSVYCIMRDFYEGRRNDQILTGELLGILATAEEEEAVDVSKVDKPKLERDMIKIGLDTLVLVDKLRKGKKVDVDLGGVIAKMIKAPTRFKLAKK